MLASMHLSESTFELGRELGGPSGWSSGARPTHQTLNPKRLTCGLPGRHITNMQGIGREKLMGTKNSDCSCHPSIQLHLFLSRRWGEVMRSIVRVMRQVPSPGRGGRGGRAARRGGAAAGGGASAVAGVHAPCPVIIIGCGSQMFRTSAGCLKWWLSLYTLACMRHRVLAHTRAYMDVHACGHAPLRLCSSVN